MENDGCNDERTNDNDDMRNLSDDNLGSCGSVDDVKTPPEDDIESLNLSSPGAFNGLSYLQSPPANLASSMRTHSYHKHNISSCSSSINSNNQNHTAHRMDRINSSVNMSRNSVTWSDCVHNIIIAHDIDCSDSDDIWCVGVLTVNHDRHLWQ